MTSSRTALAVAALALAGPLAACSGATQATPATTVTVVQAPSSSQTSQTATEQQTTADTTSAGSTSSQASSTPTHTRHSTVTTTVTQTVPATTSGRASGSSSGSTTGSAATVPTLGLAASMPSGHGIGEVRPSRVYYGGDPTGDVEGVTWSSWGGATAIGHGYGYYVGKGKSVSEAVKAPVTIRAYGLTTCDGHPAYRRVAWWFPTQGDTDPGRTAEGYDLCAKG